MPTAVMSDVWPPLPPSIGGGNLKPPWIFGVVRRQPPRAQNRSRGCRSAHEYRRGRGDSHQRRSARRRRPRYEAQQGRSTTCETNVTLRLLYGEVLFNVIALQVGAKATPARFLWTEEQRVKVEAQLASIRVLEPAPAPGLRQRVRSVSAGAPGSVLAATVWLGLWLRRWAESRHR
jgi:hypothetical protein